MSNTAHRVTLVRHAHAEWPGYQGSDFDRPLNTRGLADAAATARAIAAGTHPPTRIIASPARRTRQTAEIIAAALRLAPDAVRYIDTLYNAAEGILEEELRRNCAGTAHLLLVGHNPGISILARELSGDAKRPPLQTSGWLETRLVAGPST